MQSLPWFSCFFLLTAEQMRALPQVCHDIKTDRIAPRAQRLSGRGRQKMPPQGRGAQPGQPENIACAELIFATQLCDDSTMQQG
jgi:hypothetical protein